ncbi:MAG: imidazole glycerol phosphate synthase subunit HisH [Candidatus Oxydemutatoraceae bacterium WSBS_2016_MAG_OTU14]
MTMIAIIDYGVSNLRSVHSALNQLAPTGVEVLLSDDPQTIKNADKIVFPGQAAAKDCMRALKENHMDDAIRSVLGEKPCLGICMGLQLLLEHSTENEGVDCLGVFNGTVKHLSCQHAVTDTHKIPHMGWNQVQHKRAHPLWQDIDESAYFYFVHSYYAIPEDDDIVMGTSDYEGEFVSAIAADSIFAVQFHPEKSANDGMRFLKNFITWNGQC